MFATQQTNYLLTPSVSVAVCGDGTGGSGSPGGKWQWLCPHTQTSEGQ